MPSLPYPSTARHSPRSRLTRLSAITTGALLVAIFVYSRSTPSSPTTPTVIHSDAGEDVPSNLDHDEPPGLGSDSQSALGTGEAQREDVADSASSNPEEGTAGDSPPADIASEKQEIDPESQNGAAENEQQTAADTAEDASQIGALTSEKQEGNPDAAERHALDDNSDAPDTTTPTDRESASVAGTEGDVDTIPPPAAAGENPGAGSAGSGADGLTPSAVREEGAAIGSTESTGSGTDGLTPSATREESAAIGSTEITGSGTDALTPSAVRKENAAIGSTVSAGSGADALTSSAVREENAAIGSNISAGSGADGLTPPTTREENAAIGSTESGADATEQAAPSPVAQPTPEATTEATEREASPITTIGSLTQHSSETQNSVASGLANIADKQEEGAQGNPQPVGTVGNSEMGIAAQRSQLDAPSASGTDAAPNVAVGHTIQGLAPEGLAKEEAPAVNRIESPDLNRDMSADVNSASTTHSAGQFGGTGEVSAVQPVGRLEPESFNGAGSNAPPAGYGTPTGLENAIQSHQEIPTANMPPTVENGAPPAIEPVVRSQAGVGAPNTISQQSVGAGGMTTIETVERRDASVRAAAPNGPPGAGSALGNEMQAAPLQPGATTPGLPPADAAVQRNEVVPPMGTGAVQGLEQKTEPMPQAVRAELAGAGESAVARPDAAGAGAPVGVAQLGGQQMMNNVQAFPGKEVNAV